MFDCRDSSKTTAYYEWTATIHTTFCENVVFSYAFILKKNHEWFQNCWFSLKIRWYIYSQFIVLWYVLELTNMCFVVVREDLVDQCVISTSIQANIKLNILHIAVRTVWYFFEFDMGAYAWHSLTRIRSNSSKKGLSVFKKLLW